MLDYEWEANNDSRSVSTKPVLFLEMEEDEIDPKSYIPTLLYLSNRDVYDSTKTMCKSGANYMLFDPPSLEEVQAEAVLRYRLGGEKLFVGHEAGDGSTVAAAAADPEALIRDRIGQRYACIGPKV